MLTTMIWSEPSSPKEGVSYYDHIICDTPIGKAIIEWKSWKERDSRSLTIEDKYIGEGDTLEEAKTLLSAHLRNLSNELIEFLK